MVPRLGSSVCLPWSRLPSEHGAQGITMWAIFAERIQDAISSLESIRNHPDVSLCSTMALIYAHKCCETIDREAIQELESSLKEIRKTASGTALYHAGLFLWLIGCHDKAKEYTDRLLKVSSSSREVPAMGIIGSIAKESSIQTHCEGWPLLPQRALVLAEDHTQTPTGPTSRWLRFSQVYIGIFPWSPICR
uniref:Tetratricopeptide repeat protein 21A/21B N-terminal ARM repeat domain-containing protein n=1 Tax=Sus scrofa TaxID=9823 RepID=A0A8D1G3Y4_PIG